jgi:uncharacterized protein YceH (UPF0502 family)
MTAAEAPAWIVAGIGVGSIIMQAGIHWAVVAGLKKAHDQEVVKSETFRGTIFTKIDDIQKQITQVAMSDPAQNVKLQALEKESDFQRGRIHEIATFMQRSDSANEQVHAQLMAKQNQLEERVRDLEESARD